MAPSVSTALSPREMTALHLLAWGHTNKEIANQLDVSVKTVEAHKSNGLRKLNLCGRADLVRRAVEWGWLTPNSAPGFVDIATLIACHHRP